MEERGRKDEAWTLKEALARTVRPSVEAEFAAAKAIADADPTDEDARAELEEARHTIHATFQAMMGAARAASFGQIAARGGELVPIPAEIWRRARVEWGGSTLSYGDTKEEQAFSREADTMRGADRAAYMTYAAGRPKAWAQVRAIWKRTRAVKGMSRQERREAFRTKVQGIIEARQAEKAKIDARFARTSERLATLSKRVRSKRTHMVSVRVRPWLHLPDAMDRLDGLPLALAFRQFVLDDPQLAAIVDRASRCFPGPYSCRCSEVLSGAFTDHDRLWPAMLEDCDLAVEWMDAGPGRGRYDAHSLAERRMSLDRIAKQSDEDRTAFRIVRAAEAVVKDRIGRLLAPLREGRLIATGHLSQGSAPAVVSTAVWSRPSTRIDFIEGEVLRAAPDGQTEREWKGLTLSLPAFTQLAPTPSRAILEPIPDEEERDRGGRTPEHAWGAAFETLVIDLAQHGTPPGGAALARMMAECFQKNGDEAPPPDQIADWFKKKHNALWETAKAARKGKG